MNTPDGIYTMPAHVYHSDPADSPSLSASIAHVLLTSSPAHARAAHPRLNPGHQSEEKAAYDTGTVAHDLLLKGEGVVEVVDAPDWRTKLAREARDEARDNGRVPLLAKDYENVQAMVAAAREQIAAITDCDPPLLVDGKPEQTLVWTEDNGVVCRARIDWLHDSYYAADDIKTSSRSASPAKWSRTLWDHGCHLQAAMYLRGIRMLTGKKAEFRFCVVETSPPYALSVNALAPDALDVANLQLEHAISLWKNCLNTETWPGYPTRVCWAEAPAWEIARAAELEEVAA